MDFSKPSAQRRRSERVSQSLPMTVRGHDLLGRPFEEPTITVSFNLHGCRYTSKYHLPKNTWVTLRVKRGCEPTDRRARVAWVQRPGAIREFFHVAVEFEKPANIWALEAAPLDWTFAENVPELASTSPKADMAKHEDFAAQTQNNSGNHKEKLMDDLSDVTPFSESASSDSVVAGFAAAGLMAEPLAPEHSGIDILPLRELSAELERRARQALDGAAARAGEQAQKAAEGVHQKNLWASEEAFLKWKEEFEAAQNAREQGSVQHNELLGRMRSEVDETLGQAKRLIEEIAKNRTALRAENDAAADAQLKFEALEAARIAQLPSSQPMPDFSLEAIANWRERLESDMRAAQSQLNKLLESSLDTSVQRIAAQLAAKSKDFLRESESLVSNRFKELSQPLLDSFAQARESAIEIKSALDEELARAKASLAEIAHESAAHANNIRQQLDASAAELTVNARTQIEQATEATAAGIAEVLRRASDQEVEHFTTATLKVVQARTQELDNAAQLLRHFEANAESSLANFQSRIASQLEASIAEGRTAFSNESNAVRAALCSEQEAHQKAWTENLDRLSDEVVARYRERLETTADSWIVSSVRRLNEHGKNAIESLARSSDQALRHSCARFFDDLAKLLRGRNAEGQS